MKHALLGLLLAAACACASIVPADTATPGETAFITLGTAAGAIPRRDRSQPANLLISGDQSILIDAGDGAAQQLAKAGVPLGQIRTILISHLHLDHTAGILALLGLRYQSRVPGDVIVYGPPGTEQLVAGAVAAMQPTADVGMGIPGARRDSHATNISVVEISGGADFMLGDLRVRAIANTHYSYPPGSAEAAQFQSLSFRFDAPDRSIVYTGDTGPSSELEALARDADLLVSEIIDPAAAIASVRQIAPELPPGALTAIEHHMREQHLTAEQVGALAQRARVGRVVLTHNGLAPGGAPEALAAIREDFAGRVTVANDLDRY